METRVSTNIFSESDDNTKWHLCCCLANGHYAETAIKTTSREREREREREKKKDYKIFCCIWGRLNLLSGNYMLQVANTFVRRRIQEAEYSIGKHNEEQND